MPPWAICLYSTRYGYGRHRKIVETHIFDRLLVIRRKRHYLIFAIRSMYNMSTDFRVGLRSNWAWCCSPEKGRFSSRHSRIIQDRPRGPIPHYTSSFDVPTLYWREVSKAVNSECLAGDNIEVTAACCECATVTPAPVVSNRENLKKFSFTP